MPEVIVTPGDPTANSYATVARMDIYLGTRLWVSAKVTAADQVTKEKALIMATRAMDTNLSPHRELFTRDGLDFYRISAYWAGVPTTTTQALAWPRIGMKNRIGADIPTNVIPNELEDSVSEFATQLIDSNRLADNAVIAAGLTALRAGSVALNFKSEFVTKVLPDAVTSLLVPSWLVDSKVEPANALAFEVN